MWFFFFFQAEDGIRDYKVTGVQTCALPISSSTGTVTLSAAAPTGGAVVTLLSSNTAVANVPAIGSVTVPAGSTSTTFSVTTVSVTASTSATISASFGGVTKTALLTVSPPAPPPPLTVSGLALNPDRKSVV